MASRYTKFIILKKKARFNNSINSFLLETGLVVGPRTQPSKKTTNTELDMDVGYHTKHNAQKTFTRCLKSRPSGSSALNRY